MPTDLGVNVSHVLKAEVVGNFPRRQKRIKPKIARQIGQSIKSNRVQLRMIRDGLFQRIFQGVFLSWQIHCRHAE